MFGRKPPTNSLAMKEKTLSGVPFGNDSLSLCLSNPHSSPNLPQPWTPAFMDGAKKLCKWMNPSYEPSWASPETQLFLSATSSGQLVVEKLWNRGHLRKSTFSGLFFFITVINLFFFLKKSVEEKITCGIPITEIPQSYILLYLLPVIIFLINFFSLHLAPCKFPD